MDLKEWLGADAKAPKTLLKEHRHAEANAAKQRVKHHRSEFAKTERGRLGKDKFSLLVAETKKLPVDTKDFHFLYANYWHQICPACKTYGFEAGDEEWEDLAEDQSGAEHGYQIIERGFTPAEFYCPTCEISLVGDTALRAAGISGAHVETIEEEIIYEPEYGND